MQPSTLHIHLIKYQHVLYSSLPPPHLPLPFAAINDGFPKNVVRSAPLPLPQGSVNLIGEHTDYYEDFAPIPMTFPMVTVMVAWARHDDSGMCCSSKVATDTS